MADDYKEYTSCSKPSDWMALAPYIVIATVPLLAGAVVAIAAAGWCALFYLLVVAAAESVVVCQWWLNIRLICLGGGGDRSAIGMLINVEPSQGKTGIFNELDTDYSINLLLYPNLPGVDQATAASTPPFGELIKDQSVGDGFEGETGTEPGTNRESAVLHAEFEGAGIRDFLIGALVSFGLALAALIACAAIPPPWGIIVAAILAILAFLAWLIGYLFGAGDYADPTETTGTPSEFHTNDPNTNVGADLLYVYGRWVFDSLHAGWNEIHPIKKCTKVDTWNGAWPADIEDKLKRLDAAFDDARSDPTIDRQGSPEHRWTIHPLIDGCGRYPEPHDEPQGPR